MTGRALRWVTRFGCPAVMAAATAVLLLAGAAEGVVGAWAAGPACKGRISGGSKATPIARIQGRTHTSPLRGRTVTTGGVVTAVDTDGFYLQDPAGDGDPHTSEGIFVFTRRKPGVKAGDGLCVRGVVTEYQPGGPSTHNLTLTQLTRPRVVRTSRGNRLPAPAVLGSGGRLPPTEVIDNDNFAVFDPGEDGIDFYETLEGMRVTVRDAVAVSPTSGYGEVFVVARGTSPSGLSRRGALNVAPHDFNPERIQLDDDPGLHPRPMPRVNVGDSLGDATGVMSYGFGNYEVRLTEAVTPRRGSPRPRPARNDARSEGRGTEAATPPRGRLEPETTRLGPRDGYLTIASFNVLNLDPNDADGDADVADGRFDAVASVIARNLRGPDVVALQEVQDNDGTANTAVTAADRNLRLLTARIAAAGGPAYRFIDNPFIGDDSSGGRPGGNIRAAFLYNPDRVRLAPGSVATVTDLRNQRTRPRNPFFKSVLPLVAGFRLRASAHPSARPVTVVNVHFRARIGGSPPFGRIQPWTELQEDPRVNRGVERRRAQARAVQAFVANDLEARGGPVVVLGDFNELEFVSPLKILERSLHNLTGKLPANERYSYVFDGNAQALDHILVSGSLIASAEVDVVHVNAEFAATPARASDHDPVLARLRLPRRP